MDHPHAETRTRPVRITVDLAPADYQALNRWVAEAAIELNQPMSRVSQAQVIRAMIRAAAADDIVSGVMLDLLRREREQASKPGKTLQTSPGSATASARRGSSGMTAGHREGVNGS